MKTLHLTLKKKWFNMIASGEKTEEYREIKKYWAERLLYKIHVPWGGYMWAFNDLLAGQFDCANWKRATGSAPVFDTFGKVSFRNGYSSTSPKFDIPVSGIEIGEGKPEWGAEPGKKYFVIKLGERINS
jgi:hypothetical protein